MLRYPTSGFITRCLVDTRENTRSRRYPCGLCSHRILEATSAPPRPRLAPQPHPDPIPPGPDPFKLTLGMFFPISRAHQAPTKQRQSVYVLSPTSFVRVYRLALLFFALNGIKFLGDLFAAVLLRRQPGQVPARDKRDVPFGTILGDPPGL